MALPSVVLNPSYGQASLDASVANRAVAIQKSGQYYTLVAVSGFGSSGAVLTIEGSLDGGSTWGAAQARRNETDTLIGTIASDGLYLVVSGLATHLQLRVSTSGGAVLTVQSLGGRDKDLNALALGSAGSAIPSATSMASVTKALTSSPQQIIPARAGRASLIVTASAADTIRFGSDNTVSTTNGKQFYPKQQGDFYDFGAYAGALWGIGATSVSAEETY